jgi:hypothetical protein
VQLLKSHFVCVGIAHNGAGRRKDAEGDFARKIIGSGGTLQGLHVLNTRGDLSGYAYDFRPASVTAMLEKALQKFEPVEAPAIDSRVQDRRFVLPEGGVVVAVTTKVLGGQEPIKSAEGTIQHDMEKAWKHSLGREHLWVRQDEVQALARGELPESLKKRIVRYHLVDNTRGTPTGWGEGDIKKLEMTLDKGCLKGSVHLETGDGKRGYQADLLGFVEAQGGKLGRFDVVAHGRFWGEGRYTPGAPKGQFPLAVAFRLADVNDPLTRVVPDAVRSYPDYLRLELTSPGRRRGCQTSPEAMTGAV